MIQKRRWLMVASALVWVLAVAAQTNIYNVMNYGASGDGLADDAVALRHVGLKPTAKIPIWNGPLECRFVRFDIFEGSLKDKKAREAEEQA